MLQNAEKLSNFTISEEKNPRKHPGSLYPARNPELFIEKTVEINDCGEPCFLTTYKRVKVLHPWTPWKNMNNLLFVMRISMKIDIGIAK